MSLTRRLRFVGETVYQQARMVQYAIGHLSGPDLGDWWRHRGHVYGILKRWMREDMSAMQRSNMDVAFVSSPIDRVGAGLTAAGRMSILLAPVGSVGHQSPYFVDEGDGIHRGAEQTSGGFAGIELDGELAWLWDSAADVRYHEGANLVTVEYASRLPTTETIYVLPGTGTIHRDYQITNPDDQPRSLAFVYHSQANVNDERQFFFCWNSTENIVYPGRELRWENLDGPGVLRIGADQPTTATARERGGEFGGSTVSGDYLQGRLRHETTLPPGESLRLTVSITAGADPGGELRPGERSQRERQQAAIAWWERWIPDGLPGDSPPPIGTGNTVNDHSETNSPEIEELYHRSIALLGALSDPGSGAISASPNLQPPYYPCWPRDSAFVAVALARAGRLDRATELLAEFLPRVQEPAGFFKQCYTSDGRFAGAVHVEADQQPLYSWAVREVGERAGEEFLRSAWPAVRKTLRFTVESIGTDDLLRPTPDIDEWPHSVRQSLWTNTWAYRGLRAGAEMASVLGQRGDEFAAAADRVGAAIRSTFFDETPFRTVRDTGGFHRDLHAYDSVALFPTRWASDYGEAERVRASLVDLAADEPTWIPGAFMLAAALYRTGEGATAEALFQRTVPLQTVAGHLIERHTTARDFDFASPLAWSHAAFVLAVQARADWVATGRAGSQHGVE